MTTRWFLEAGDGEDPRDWVPGQDGRPVWCPAPPRTSPSRRPGGSGIPAEEFRRALRLATEEPGRTVMVPASAWQVREAAPSLYGLRRAYLDAGNAVAAGEALLAFLAELGKVRAVADLDALDEACTEPERDRAVDVAGLVTAVLAVAAFYGLVVAAVTGHLALTAASCVLVLAAAGLLRHVAPVRRARRR